MGKRCTDLYAPTPRGFTPPCTTRQCVKNPSNKCINPPAPQLSPCSPPFVTHHSDAHSCLLPQHRPPPLCFPSLPHRIRLPPCLTHSRYRAMPLHRRCLSACLDGYRVDKRDQSAPLSLLFPTPHRLADQTFHFNRLSVTVWHMVRGHL